MKHGRKGCGRTDKDKLRGASRRQHKRERRGVCIRPGPCVSVYVYPSCARWLVAKKGLVAKEFSPCDCVPPDLTNGTHRSTVNAF